MWHCASFRRWLLTSARAQLDIWAPNPVLLAGAYTAQSALADAEKYPNAVIAFGRHFISNVSSTFLGGVHCRRH